MVTAIATIVGIVGILGSVLFAGWQSREVARQTRIQNLLAGASGVRESAAPLQTMMLLFVDHPELKPFFYAGQPCTVSGSDLVRVMTIAEMFGDVLDTALYTTSRIKATAAYDGWRDYALFLLRESQALRRTLETYPLWWPNLKALYESMASDLATPPEQRETADTAIAERQ